MPKILLVEDNAANADMLSRRLRKVGYEVVAAGDGECAVSMASSERPDLILMDLDLPVLDGWAATRRIKDRDAKTRGIPVIALTAHAMRHDRERAEQAGCDDYETKPINLPRLLGKIEARLAPHPGTGAAPVEAAENPPAPALGAGSSPRPSSSEMKPTPATAAPVADPPPAGRLLIVDDNAVNCDLLARRFRRSGYETITAPDGPTAMQIVRAAADGTAAPIDLVLLDVMMPVVSGLEVLDDIRRIHPATDLPVIMVTALDGTSDIVNAFDHGANDYVTKPINFDVVTARVQTQLALKSAIDQIRALEYDLAVRNRSLHSANQRMKADLNAAVKVQAALLPTASPEVPGYHFAWLFNPSAELAGDIFNVFRLDERHVGVYVLDVSGHGVAAALLSVTVSRFLVPMADPTSLLWERGSDETIRMSAPARVAQRLSERFPFDTVTGQFFTLVYGVLDLLDHKFRYVSAGHPQLVHRGHRAPAKLLESSGYPVGVGTGEYEEVSVELMPGDRLYLYSDGIPETMNPEGEPFGTARLLRAVGDHEHESAEQNLERLGAEICRWSEADRCQDDQTVVCIERI